MQRNKKVSHSSLKLISLLKKHIDGYNSVKDGDKNQAVRERNIHAHKRRRLQRRDTGVGSDKSMDDISAQNSNITYHFLLDGIQQTNRPNPTPLSNEQDVNRVLGDQDEVTQQPSSRSSRPPTTILALGNDEESENGHVDLAEQALAEPFHEISEERPECDVEVAEGCGHGELLEENNDNVDETNDEHGNVAVLSNTDESVVGNENGPGGNGEEPVVDVPIDSGTNQQLSEPETGQHGRRELPDEGSENPTEGQQINEPTPTSDSEHIGNVRNISSANQDNSEIAIHGDGNTEFNGGTEGEERNRNETLVDNERESGGGEEGTLHVDSNESPDTTEGEGGLVSGEGHIESQTERGETSEEIRTEKDGGKNGAVKELPDDGHENDGSFTEHEMARSSLPIIEPSLTQAHVLTETENEALISSMFSTPAIESSLMTNDVLSASSFDYYIDYESDYFDTDLSSFSASMFSMNSDSYLSSFSVDSTAIEPSSSFTPTMSSVYISDSAFSFTETSLNSPLSTMSILDGSFTNSLDSIYHVESEQLMSTQTIDSVSSIKSDIVSTPLPDITVSAGGIVLTIHSDSSSVSPSVAWTSSDSLYAFTSTHSLTAASMALSSSNPQEVEPGTSSISSVQSSEVGVHSLATESASVTLEPSSDVGVSSITVSSIISSNSQAITSFETDYTTVSSTSALISTGMISVYKLLKIFCSEYKCT